jgi:mono/diheme cytochrome c family protein
MTPITRSTLSPSRRGNSGGARRGLLTAALSAAFLLFLAGAASRTAAQKKTSAPPPANAAANAALVARGKYIVEDVAVCANCHSPRDENGQLDHSRWLLGGPVFFQPAITMPDWPQLEPRLAGQPPATDAEMIRLLTTGIWTDGKHLRQPMPQFRMTQADAEAVIAYLKTL